MRKLLLATTILAALATPTWAADVDRVPELCAKRQTCLSMVSTADLQPALLREGDLSQAQRNPDPFHQFTPQAQAPVQAPATAQSSQQPQIFVQQPSQLQQPRDLFDWFLMGIAGIFTAIFGTGQLRKNGQKPDLREILDSPDLHAKLLQTAQRVIATGLPGQVVSQIPGAGLAEPLIRQVANELIERRLGSLTGHGAEVLSDPNQRLTIVPADKLGGLLDGVEQLMRKLSAQNQQQPKV